MPFSKDSQYPVVSRHFDWSAMKWNGMEKSPTNESYKSNVGDLFTKVNAFAALRSRLHFVSLEMTVGCYFFFLKTFFLNMNKLKMMKTTIRIPKVMSAWVNPWGA